jgi:hypothetical protein
MVISDPRTTAIARVFLRWSRIFEKKRKRKGGKEKEKRRKKKRKRITS